VSASQAPDTRVDLAGIRLRNPVLTASGTFGYGTEFAPFLDLRRIGGFVAKSLTLEPRFGNPPPRIAETPSGMLNAISLENVGVRAFVEEKLPAIPDGVVVIASAFETEIDRGIQRTSVHSGLTTGDKGSTVFLNRSQLKTSRTFRGGFPSRMRVLPQRQEVSE